MRRDQVLSRQPRSVAQAQWRDLDPGPLQKLAADLVPHRRGGVRASVIVEGALVGAPGPQLPQQQFRMQVLALFVDDFEHLGERLRFDAGDFEQLRFVERPDEAGGGVQAIDPASNADTATVQSFSEQYGGEASRIVYGDVDLDLIRAARDRPEKLHRIAVEWAVDADAGSTAVARPGVVDDFEVARLRLNFDRGLIARASRGSDGERDAVVIDRQGADLSAVIELRVVPLPAGTEQIAGEKAVVADQIPRDDFDPAGLDLIGQSFDGCDRVGGFE